MFLEYLFEVPNMTNGIDDMLVDLAHTNSIFIPMLLLFIFFVVFIGGSSSQKKRTGTADIPMWAVVSSLSTFMVTLALTLISGLVNMLTLIIVICITILSGAWLFLDKSNKEV
jgi:hypothetical protein